MVDLIYTVGGSFERATKIVSCAPLVFFHQFVCVKNKQTTDPACQHKIIVRNGNEDKNNEALMSFCLFVAGAQTNGGIVRCFSQNCTKKASSLGRPCSDFL